MLTIVLATSLVACASPPPARSDRGVVVGHVDGDTIDVSFDPSSPARRIERVRLIGIDTPELARPDRPEECFAAEASAALAGMAPIGATVRLERDVVPRDDYGRLLGYLYRPDGSMVNLILVEAGVARPMTIAPNRAHAASFVAAAHRAELAGHGLWAGCR